MKPNLHLIVTRMAAVEFEAAACYALAGDALSAARSHGVGLILAELAATPEADLVDVALLIDRCRSAAPLVPPKERAVQAAAAQALAGLRQGILKQKVAHV